VVRLGLQEFLDIGVDPSKIVLGVPWYGYHYPAVHPVPHDQQ
jgi:hypothetical protein